jgi:ParB-like nuclease domain
MLVPVVVRRDGEHFELVAAFHRVAAARKLGLTEVPCVERGADSDAADRAVENIASCRCRHDRINADVVVMPTLVARCRRSGANPLARLA